MDENCELQRKAFTMRPLFIGVKQLMSNSFE